MVRRQGEEGPGRVNHWADTALISRYTGPRRSDTGAREKNMPPEIGKSPYAHHRKPLGRSTGCPEPGCQGRRQNIPVGRSKSVPPERSLASVNVRASCSGEVSQRQAGSRLGE